MKVLAQILIALSVTLGVVAAATAYLAPVSMGGRLNGLTLAAPAGKMDDRPVATEGTKLTPELVEQLRVAGVKYVKVKESPVSVPNPKFDPGADTSTNTRAEPPTKFELGAMKRWPGRWLFLGAAAGLGLGAFLVRRASKAAIAAALRPDAVTEGRSMSPDDAITGLLATIAAIERDVKLHADDSARLAVIADRIGESQRTHIDAFLQGKALLQGRLGASGFASLMDRFSHAERRFNRAWSAAIDGVYPEAIGCVREAEKSFLEAQRLLG